MIPLPLHVLLYSPWSSYAKGIYIRIQLQLKFYGIFAGVSFSEKLMKRDVQLFYGW